MEFTKDIKFNQKPTFNRPIDITYTGCLSNSSEVSIVYGYNENWEHTTEQKMIKTENGFATSISLMNYNTLNFCFKNQDNQWDNNSNCNYITNIYDYTPDIEKIQMLFDGLNEVEEPKQNVTFDIDALIEEILQPIINQSSQIVEDPSLTKIIEQPIDLGVEISKILSEIDFVEQPVMEFSSIDDVLDSTIINSTDIEELEELPELELITETPEEAIAKLFENTFDSLNIADDIISEIANIKPAHFTEEQYEKFENISNIISETEEEITTSTSLINVDDPFIISPRQLSSFYLFRKRIKLALYKALVHIPKLIFGSNEN